MKENMRFACMIHKGCSVIKERAIPELAPNEVLVKNIACNICTTDYGQWMGLREHQGYPMVGGHEGCGVVEKVGTEVQYCKPGDFVGINSYKGCGICGYCRKGEVSKCENPPKLMTKDGYLGEFGFSTHAVWEENAVIKMNPKLDPGCAGFLEPLATVIKGQKKLRLASFETVVVIGGGTMGMLNALEARARGARVIVSELMEKKLALAKELGFETVDSGKEDAVRRVKELTDGKGADCVIVAVGVKGANQQSIDMVKNIDGRILLFAAGYPAPPMDVDSNLLHYRRLELIGTYGADNEDFEDAANRLNQGMIDVSGLIEPVRYPLTKMQEAFQAASTPGMYRVCVECQK